MRKWGLQTLETYDLVEYARQADCYFCRGGNRCDAEFCRHCKAPLALSQQAEHKKTGPRLVAVIGGPGAGKTAYLGMLTDILSRQHGGLQILARGAFSVSLQQQAMSALARRQFPPRTRPEPDGWNWVHCQVTTQRRRRAIELVMPDLSGEAFLSEVEHAHTFPVIRSFLSKCAGAILLIDAAALENGQVEEDFLAMKIVSFLAELDAGGKRSWQRRPLALVFSKCDQSPNCWEDPADFARRQTPGLWRLCEGRLPRHRYFATSIAGATVDVRMDGETWSLPLRIEPRGVVEPFAWLVDELK